MYAQFLSVTFKATSSIKNYLAGVKTLHTLTDTDVSMFQATELKLTTRGLARLKPHCPKSAAPITPHILLAIYASLDLSDTKQLVFWALFLLAFFTFARKSNLVSSGKSQKQICRRDILVGASGLAVIFNWSKTIQFGQRRLIVPVVSVPQSPLCPVHAIRKMYRRVPAPKDGPAFVLPGLGSGALSPVTYSQYQSFLRKVISRIGLNPLDYSSHSFRRGGATWAFRSQVPGELIKVHGDWASDAYLKYLDFSLEQRMQVAQTMSQCLPQ